MREAIITRSGTSYILRDLDYVRRHPEGKDQFRPFDRALFKGVRAGSLVKIWVEAANHDKPCGECFWTIVRAADKHHKVFTCEVNNRLHRTQYHGLKMGDIIKVKREHVIDIGVFR